MSIETGRTPNGNRVTIEYESRVEGPGPHVFIYDGVAGGTELRSRRGKRRSKLLMSLSVVWKAIVGLLNKRRQLPDRSATRWQSAGRLR
jgi:hypothetical protein